MSLKSEPFSPSSSTSPSQLFPPSPSNSDNSDTKDPNLTFSVQFNQGENGNNGAPLSPPYSPNNTHIQAPIQMTNLQNNGATKVVMASSPVVNLGVTGEVSNFKIPIPKITKPG